MELLKKIEATRQKLFDAAGIHPKSIRVATNGPVRYVHYLELGSGKPLIIVHGGGGLSSQWINILKPLAEQFHLYVVDRPGHGHTDPFNYRGVDLRKHTVEFLDSFMNAVSLDKALLMANSMGGYFSIRFAIEHPQRVEKLLLIGAPAGMNLWIPWKLRLLGTQGLNKVLSQTVAKPSIANAKNIFRELLVADIKKIPEDYWEHIYYHQLLLDKNMSFVTLLENVLTLRGWKRNLYVGDQLNRLTMPVDFIWGTEDAFEKPESGKQKVEAIESHRFEVVENAGHLPWLDQPTQCTELILSMLQE